MLNCLEKEALFRCTCPCLVYWSERGSSLTSHKCCFTFFPWCKPMQNRDFPLAIGMLLFGVTAVTRWTPESAPSTGGTFRFLARSPEPMSARWWPWQHWASQGPCASWQPESMSRKGGVHAVHNSFLVSKTRRFRETFQIAFDSDFWVAVAMAF